MTSHFSPLPHLVWHFWPWVLGPGPGFCKGTSLALVFSFLFRLVLQKEIAGYLSVAPFINTLHTDKLLRSQTHTHWHTHTPGEIGEGGVSGGGGGGGGEKKTNKI
jgi:hypothetical protein